MPRTPNVYLYDLKRFRTIPACCPLLFMLVVVATAQQIVTTAQQVVDPGVRSGTPGAGGPLPGLTNFESKYFNSGLDEFQEIASVTGSIPGTEAGLGPRFNLDSCVGCHTQPAIGGSSPAVNPQVAVATKNGATNTLPSFITSDGPVREVRFKSDGGVHDLFTIKGRTDAAGCNVAQPDFSNTGNLSFRIPTPVFGLGMIESIPDSIILANKSANGPAKRALGIDGHENREGNAGTITRIGWKAQNKSGLIFAGEAYNVEMGITNEAFQSEREETPGCMYNSTPEDHTNFDETQTQAISSGVVKFALFMRFLAPPAPACVPPGCSASINNGRALFDSVGCALCHTPSLNTGHNSSAALYDKNPNLFSDLLVHRMGSALADGITQGSAGPDEFRTAPLWGLGQRIFFLHDGRTRDLLQAIQAHSSSNSEANGVIKAFNALPATGQQDILNFLRSL